MHAPPVVREWVETICGRIAKLKPNRALELGAGNGMILLRLAQACEHYVGTDLSTTAIEYVRGAGPEHCLLIVYPPLSPPHCHLHLGPHIRPLFTIS